MISRAYILGAQRARTRWPGAPRAGVERRQVGAGPLSSNLLSQVTDPPRIVQVDFTIYSAVRESTSEGEKVWQIFRPKENFGRHTIHLPGHLDYHLIWRLYWSFSTFTVLVEFGKRQVRPHEGTWCNDWKDGPNFPKVSCLANKFFTARCKHIKEWVCWLLPGRRGETYIVLQLSSSSHLPTENIWWSKLQPDICQNDLIQVGLPQRVKV